MSFILKVLSAAAVVGAARASNFHVFDNTAYTNTSIGYQSTNINWIPAYVCNPLTKGGFLPSVTEWKNIVLEWNVYPGYPLVLDCEDIYFTNESTADLYLEILSSLQTWAAEVIPPGQIIGWYGLSHAFFPSAYTFSSSISTWNNSLNSVINTITAINDTLPIWPYTWPQYHNNYSFIPVELWETELEILSSNSHLDGFVIWGGKNYAVCNDSCQATAGQQPWLNATRSYLSNLYGIYNGKLQKTGAQIFSL
ncbi:hypothetical protein TSTA_124220 [Talaromyces stipitatus ATCC 10500]|uniref:Uncharacterized protein n=1 Tax=Talaromyces stipitatus (strain ATCC 10500 / CBS 375.48 / QM 6759 / NRRL 1006) TaxID=441959 RepID=B8MAZ3_TALSN|nr:uncharacterized protein TSTA_124220 [Talaromyces stipitatus ATCC 10500]EED18694.1 hypothetical protein TSTA_124220 [Talaromyces stipitatus ATCC 10500]